MALGDFLLPGGKTEKELLKADLQEIEQRLSALEASSSRLSVIDADPPTLPATPGALALNRATGAVWEVQSGAWVRIGLLALSPGELWADIPAP